jgi:hypothetical protein
MIAQLVNREYLLDELDATRNDLARALQERKRRSGRRTELDKFDTPDLADLLAKIAEVQERPEGLQAGEPTERQTAAPMEDFAYIPRDPLLSNLQSALEEYYLERAPDSVETARLADEARRGSASGPIVTDTTLTAVPLRRTPTGRRLWGRFEVARPKILSDPRWVLSLFAMGYRGFHHKEPFNKDFPPPVAIGDDVRLLVVGDWGSGIPRARAVAARMRAELEKGSNERREQHVIHLGDVYYSGWTREYEEHFLKYWPVDAGETDIASFALNGNHDMYSGGKGYFGTCLADARFARQKGSSVFALRNANWQILALDSAYEDGALYGDQVEWVKERIEEGGGRRTMLMCHHNPFSAYEEGATRLREALTPVLATGRIDAWLWGHEHRCLVYRPHLGLRFASCIGHGGIPEYLIAKEGQPYPQPPAPPLRYDYRRVEGGGLEPWDTFGFAVLEVQGRAMTVHYIDEHGNPHRTETISADH